MPELPEVEVVRQGLAPLVCGRTVFKVVCSGPRLRLPVPRARLNALVAGHRIEAIDRRAKYLLFTMSGGAVLIIHLGMSGRLGLFPAAAPRAKHDHLRFVFDHGMEMRFNDTRRFGSVQVLTAAEMKEQYPFAGLGPEPLGRKFSAAYLLNMARQRRQPVKNFLMDSRVVVGIGNIYANEILFAAGILPTTPAGAVDLPAWRRIVAATRFILKNAIACGGTTIADYVNASGESGYFQLELKVYGRNGLPCPVCRQPIQKKVLAGRSSFFCPRCQH